MTMVSALRLPILLIMTTLASAITGCAGGHFTPQPAFSIQGERIENLSEDPYTRGKSHLATGRLGLALRDFHRALAHDPHSIAALNATAVAYDLIGRPDSSERYFAWALERDPEHVATLNNFGRWHLRHGRVDLARVYLGRAAALDPENRIVLANRRDARARAVAATRVTVAPPRAAVAEAATAHSAWIERSGRAVHTLVTRPDPEVLRGARERGVDPRLVSFVSPSPESGIGSRWPLPTARGDASRTGAATAPPGNVTCGVTSGSHHDGTRDKDTWHGRAECVAPAATSKFHSIPAPPPADVVVASALRD